MENMIIVAAAVFVIAAMVAAPMDLASWMAKNHRVPFFVKMYRTWSRKKGEQVVANAKKAY